MTPAPSSDSNKRPESDNSSDPKTETGKKPSSMNALKFGFFSKKALLPGESWEDYVQFQEHLLRQLGPRDSLERHLMDLYVPLVWRLKRLPEIEAGIFNRYGISVQGNQCGPAFALVANVQSDNILGQLARYEATQRKYAIKYLELLRAGRKKATKKGPSSDATVIDVPAEPAEQTLADTKQSGSAENSEQPEKGNTNKTTHGPEANPT